MYHSLVIHITLLWNWVIVALNSCLSDNSGANKSSLFGMTRGGSSTEGGLEPQEEKVSPEEMIESMTIIGAGFNFPENEIGSIEVGKPADITVIDRDLFETAVEDIKGLNMLMTLFEEEIVYNR